MIYLDHNSTTPIDKAVADAMLPYIYENFGNPSSSHPMGRAAKQATDLARSQVANLLNCSADEIVFTGSGSEANNTIIKGVAEAYRHKGRHIITSRIEHPSVMETCKYLEKSGYLVTYLPVNRYGEVEIEQVKNAITGDTILVTVMHSNNETGTLQPIKAIAGLCRQENVLLHTDASQSIGKVPVDIQDLGVDFLTLAGPKLYAPKGIGAFYCKNGVALPSLIHGAGHEGGRRAGTENVIFIVGLGKACEIAVETLKSSHVLELSQYFYQGLQQLFQDKVQLNGHFEQRLPNTLNISFLGYSSAQVMEKLTDVAVSAGSACHAGSTEISPVLKAMGVSLEVGMGAIRFSLGKDSTRAEIDQVLEKLKQL
ncbi:cysteine desulfurase [Thalassomonas viridans]|uniref:cysteine desulfurase n=1 Tax=Thalassomonas viridans TaxID=137584 RepID=A0AAE9ZBA8_9GAMM|nr:cysteine desulfurase family protein [Thalassomonas viridans]WDE09049.1 cysteine desulfurase [Thalassomonas viridans]